MTARGPIAMAHPPQPPHLEPAAELEIVRADLSDLDAVAPLFDQYRVFYRQAPDPAGARAFIEERLTWRDSMIFLARLQPGLRTNGDGAGFVQLYPSFSSVSMRRIWILNDLFVAPAARRLGVARMLLDRARDFAAEDGAKRIELTTEKTNTVAQALYRAVGYEQDDVFIRLALTLES